MSRVCALTPRSMAASAAARVAVVERARRDRMCIQPTMALSGPRSSWEAVATNSSLSWLAASAALAAAC